MPTKTDLVKLKLAENPSPTYDQIKVWAKDIGCSPSLFYKILRAMPEIQRAVKAAEPVVTVAEEIEEIKEEIPSFEIPEEFKPAEEVEVVPEKPAEVVLEEKPSEEEEEQRILRDISKRAIKRFFAIGIEELAGLGKEYGLTDQESEDTEVLVMLFLAKYLMIEIKENLLEITGVLHFGSVGVKLLIAWVKKRREEAKKREEEEKRKLPEKPLESVPVVPASELTGDMKGEALSRGESPSQEAQHDPEAEKKYLKKLGLR